MKTKWDVSHSPKLCVCVMRILPSCFGYRFYQGSVYAGCVYSPQTTDVQTNQLYCSWHRRCFPKCVSTLNDLKTETRADSLWSHYVESKPAYISDRHSHSHTHSAALLDGLQEAYSIIDLIWYGAEDVFQSLGPLIQLLELWLLSVNHKLCKDQGAEKNADILLSDKSTRGTLKRSHS